MAEKKPKKKYDPEESIRKREETARKRREAALRNKALLANQARPARALNMPPARVSPAVGQRALGMLGGAVGLGATGMTYSPPAQAPTLYDASLIPGPVNPRREQTARRMLSDPYGFARGPQAARIPPRQLPLSPPETFVDYQGPRPRDRNAAPEDLPQRIRDRRNLQEQMQAELAQLYENELGPRYQPTGEELLDVYPTDAGMTYPGAPGQPPMETFVDYQGPRPRDRNAAPEDLPQRIRDRRNLQEQTQADISRLYADEIGPRYQDVGEDLLNVYPLDAGMDRPAVRTPGQPPMETFVNYPGAQPGRQSQPQQIIPRQIQPPPPMLNDLFERMPGPQPQQQLPQAAPDRMQASMNPMLAAALGMRDMDVDLSGAFEPGMADDIPLAEQFTPGAGLSPYEFGRDYLNPAGMSAHEFGQEYLNPLLTSAPTGYSYLQNTLGRGIADLMRGAAGYEQLPEEQELIEAVDRPDLAQQQMATPEPGAVQGITRTSVDPYEQQRIALIEEYMAGQQQADPRQRRIMGSADEFAANQPPPRMSQQQLDAALMQLAREESMQATDPFAGYDDSLFPEQFVDDRFPRGVTVDPVTGATSFEGGQRYARDAELPGRQSMDDLRLGTEYTSRALRNLGRARGVPSPQEVERSRMLSTLGGDARGQGYRVDQLEEQMRRTRSRLNSQNLTPLELDAGRAQLEALDSERAGALTAQDRARALQLRGVQTEPLAAPEDVVLEQLQEAATARAQAEADAEQRRWLTEREIAGRNQVGAQDMQRYTEMFASMEPSAVPEGMSLASADPETQEAEKARVNRIQLATTLASSQEGFRTQPALAMETARLLSTLRDNPRRQTAYMNVLLEADPSELAQALQILYEKLGAT